MFSRIDAGLPLDLPSRPAPYISHAFLQSTLLALNLEAHGARFRHFGRRMYQANSAGLPNAGLPSALLSESSPFPVQTVKRVAFVPTHRQCAFCR